MNTTFISSLKDWSDPDVAAFELCRALGLLNNDATLAKDAKSVLWTQNRVSQSLYGILKLLVDGGVLEYDEKAEKYRTKRVVQKS